MAGLLRRLDQRHDTNLVLEIGITDHTATIRPETTSQAMMINVSKGGCCIVLYTPLVAGEHLFYKTLQSERYLLWLGLQTTDQQEVTLKARPIWMDGCVYADRQAFKVGVEFVNKQKDLSIFKNAARDTPAPQ